MVGIRSFGLNRSANRFVFIDPRVFGALLLEMVLGQSNPLINIVEE